MKELEGHGEGPLDNLQGETEGTVLIIGKGYKTSVDDTLGRGKGLRIRSELVQVMSREKLIPDALPANIEDTLRS